MKPTLHILQAVWPGRSWNDPALQGSHRACPGALVKVPAAQMDATVEPIVADQPESTSSQVLLSLWPGLLELVPAGQSVVVTAPIPQ